MRSEAVQRPSTRCVPVKTDDQLDLQALHRVRSRLISERTAVINQIRGFLLERGIPVRGSATRISPGRCASATTLLHTVLGPNSASRRCTSSLLRRWAADCCLALVTL